MIEQQGQRQQATQDHNGGREPVEQRVVANGIEQCYLEWPGPAPAKWPPVVLLHGVLQTGEGMANLAAHLARNARVIAPDLRGRGGSEQPADGYDPATMADDIAALTEAIDVDRPVVIGRMHGGVVAYHLAGRHPQAVRGLVIGDSPPEVDSRRAARALSLVHNLPPRFVSFDEALAFYQETLQLSEARARHDIPYDLIEEGDGGLRWRHNLALVERIENAAMPRADWDVLATIACPTLFLRGQRGETPPEMAERVCQTITRARCRVQTILGARHDVFLGPGCEQSFGAIDVFLMGLANGPASGNGQLPLQSHTAEAITMPVSGGDDGKSAVERIVRAIHSHDPVGIAALFAPDCHITQYGEGGKIRDGGLDAVHAAFAQIFIDAPTATVEVRDLVATDDEVACVFTIRQPGIRPATTIFAPAFFRLRDGQVAEFTSYRLRLPAGET